MTTNLRDLALRMTGHATAEGRKVEDLITAARTSTQSADVAKSQADQDAVRGMTMGQAISFLMRRGPAAPVNSPAPLTAPKPRPLTKAVPQPLTKAAVGALRAEIDAARLIVTSPAGRAKLDEFERTLDTLVGIRGVQ